MTSITVDKLTNGTTVYVFAIAGTGIKAHGKTESQAYSNYKLAIIDYVNSCIADNVDVPENVIYEYNKITKGKND